MVRANTGGHRLFSCYGAFLHIADPRSDQQAKWLETTRQIVEHGDDMPETRDWVWPYPA